MRRTALAAASLAALLAPRAADALVTPPSLVGHEHREALRGEPIRWQRQLAFDARLRGAARRLGDEVGGGAHASWDVGTGVPSRIWGRGVAVAPAEQAKHARAVLDRNLAVLAPGAAASDFVPAADVTRVRRGVAIRVISFEQRAGGLRVVGGQVSFRFVAGRLVMVASEASPFARAATGASIEADTARGEAELALQDVAVEAWASEVGGPLVLPLVGASGVRHATVLRVVVDTRPLGRWAVFLDASTGEPVAREQLLRFATADLSLDVPVRWPAGGRAAFPAQRANVTVGGAPAQTDELGVLTWAPDATAQVTLDLAGPWVKVLDNGAAAASDAFSIDPGGAHLWSGAAVPTLDAQLTAFVHTQLAKERVRAIDPTFVFFQQQTLATVNIADACNAFSDGTDINFYAAGGPCENTGRLADVIHHEYGHSVHAHAVVPGVGEFESALSEGLADYLAATMSGDSGMGRGFYFTSEPLRELDPPNFEYRWPDDVAGDPHATGQIIGGALWDLREALIAKHGDAAGVALTDALTLDAQSRAVDIPTMYHEILVADDDDGDLENGTPNVCEIDAAFAPHGLKAVTASVTQAGAAAVSEQGYVVTAAMEGLFAQCAGQAVGEATLEWRVRGNPAVGGELPMVSAQGNDFTATIPAQPAGTVVQYQVRVSLGGGQVLQFPKNPADEWYELFVGEVVPLYCTDFETDPENEGWTHGATIGNPNQDGVDDWQWGKPYPHAASGDPTEAFSFTRVYGNDLGKGNFNGSYRPNIQNYTVTPTVDVSGHPVVRLQYRRWLNVEDAHFDQAKIYGNDVQLWQNVDSDMGDASSLQHRDGEWRFHDVDLSGVVADGQVAVKFEITSDGGLELGGWTLDDLCIVGYVPPPPPPACGNGVLEAGEACDEGAANGAGACRTDCTVVACGDGVLDPGEACDDMNLDDGDGCSAACQDEAAPPPNDVVAEGGCGCQAPSRRGPGALALAAAAALALARRRGARRGPR